MVKFAEMAVFSSRPETSAAMGFEPMDETLIPSALSRYQQIIFPVGFYFFFFFKLSNIRLFLRRELKQTLNNYIMFPKRIQSAKQFITKISKR